MTETEMRLDNEVGNDTEHARITFLKYVNYGKQLALETSGLITLADADKLANDKALLAIVEIEQSIERCRVLQAEVEKDDEKAVFASLQFETDVATLYRAVGEMLKRVDEKHSELISARNGEIAAIKAKYLPPSV